MTVQQIARVCHEMNKAICEAAGDYSQKYWDEAEEWQRSSTIEGVSFAIGHPEAPASAQHDAWSKSKFEDGWKYGEVKDAVAKTHPCLVAFEELPFDQKIKDVIFKQTVASLRYL